MRALPSLTVVSTEPGLTSVPLASNGPSIETRPSGESPDVALRSQAGDDALHVDRCVEQYGLLRGRDGRRWGRGAGGLGPSVVAISSWGLIRGRARSVRRATTTARTVTLT